MLLEGKDLDKLTYSFCGSDGGVWGVDNFT